MIDLDTLDALSKRLHQQAKWSHETFGPRQTTTGVLSHVRKELAEIEANPYDPVEWMDAVILLFDGAMRCGHPPLVLLLAWMEKLDANEQRQWQWPD